MSKLDDITNFLVAGDVDWTHDQLDGTSMVEDDLKAIEQNRLAGNKKIKALMLELIGEDSDARSVDRGNEAYNPNSEDYRYGFNLAQAIIRKKVEEL